MPPTKRQQLPRLISVTTSWELGGQVLLVTLNRPDRLNALDERMMSELRTLWSAVAELPDIRCVAVTGAGKGFCAGADAALLQSDRGNAPTSARQELSFLPRHRIDVR